jgi:hypothetical protein
MAKKIKLADFEFLPVFAYGNSAAKEKILTYPFVGL